MFNLLRTQGIEKDLDWNARSSLVQNARTDKLGEELFRTRFPVSVSACFGMVYTVHAVCFVLEVSCFEAGRKVRNTFCQ